jgi:hypothetical protein
MDPVFVLALALAAALPCSPPACTCIGVTPVRSVETAREALSGAAAVFVARAERVDVRVRPVQGPDTTRPPLPWREAVVRLRVERRFKGPPADTITVVSGLGGGDCSIGFERGRRYLVYIPRPDADPRAAAPDGPPYVSDCDGTKALEEARAEVRYLEHARRRAPRP